MPAPKKRHLTKAQATRLRSLVHDVCKAIDLPEYRIASDDYDGPEVRALRHAMEEDRPMSVDVAEKVYTHLRSAAYRSNLSGKLFHDLHAVPDKIGLFHRDPKAAIFVFPDEGQRAAREAAAVVARRIGLGQKRAAIVERLLRGFFGRYEAFSRTTLGREFLAELDAAGWTTSDRTFFRGEVERTASRMKRLKRELSNKASD